MPLTPLMKSATLRRVVEEAMIELLVALLKLKKRADRRMVGRNANRARLIVAKCGRRHLVNIQSRLHTVNPQLLHFKFKCSKPSIVMRMYVID